MMKVNEILKNLTKASLVFFSICVLNADRYEIGDNRHPLNLNSRAYNNFVDAANVIKTWYTGNERFINNNCVRDHNNTCVLDHNNGVLNQVLDSLDEALNLALEVCPLFTPATSDQPHSCPIKTEGYAIDQALGQQTKELFDKGVKIYKKMDVIQRFHRIDFGNTQQNRNFSEKFLEIDKYLGEIKNELYWAYNNNRPTALPPESTRVIAQLLHDFRFPSQQ